MTVDCGDVVAHGMLLHAALWAFPVVPAIEERGAMPVTVLVVDDDPEYRWITMLTLRMDPSVTVVGEAADGETALALIPQQHPQLVLMDVIMPRLDGLEATRKIKHDWPATKVLVLTSLTGDEVRRDLVDSGADGFLDKREIATGLLAAVRALTPDGGA